MSFPPSPAAWGLLSALLCFFAFLPYLRDTLFRTTRPQRASWLIWSVLSSIAFAAQVYEGASASLWFAGAQVAGTVNVFAASIFRGTGGITSRRDCAVLSVAGIGLVLWYFTDTAAYALAITIAISLLGGTVTVAKAYARPESETGVTWLLSLFGSITAMFAVGTPDPVLLAYPVYLFVLNGAILVAMALGQSVDRARPVFASVRTRPGGVTTPAE